MLDTIIVIAFVTRESNNEGENKSNSSENHCSEPIYVKKKEAEKNFTSLTARGKEKVALLVCAFVLQDTLPSS